MVTVIAVEFMMHGRPHAIAVAVSGTVDEEYWRGRVREEVKRELGIVPKDLIWHVFEEDVT